MATRTKGLLLKVIAAQGSTLEITPDGILVEYSPLYAALLGKQRERIPLDSITDVEVVEPTTVDSGVVRLNGTRVGAIVFPPNSATNARECAQMVKAAQKGEDVEVGVSVPAIVGLNFAALDVETANAWFGSICQVGVTTVRDGKVTDSATWLCRPPAGRDEFDPINVSVHGITAEDVKDAPRFGEILGEILSFVGDFPLVAHNAQFDATALFQAAQASGAAAPHLYFGCTLAAARAHTLTVENHKLPTLAQEFGASLTAHHDAGADAHAAADIMVGLARRDGFAGNLEDYMHSLSFTMGEITGDRVIPVLKDRTGKGTVRGGKKPSISGAGTDFRTPKRPPAPWAAVATPDTVPEANKDANPDNPLFGQHVTLTGDFEPYDKGRLWNDIAAAGGEVGKNVTKKTTVLVIGTWASVTSKEKRARALQDKGQDIALWPAEKLYSALGLDEQPPF